MFFAEATSAVPAVYKTLAASNEWGRLVPELLMASLAVLTLVESMFQRKREIWHTPVLVKGFLILLAVLSGISYCSGATATDTSFGGMILQQGRYTELIRIFFMFTALAVTHLGGVWLRRSKLPHTEFYFLTLIACTAMMLLTQANHFVLFFVALETVAICLYALVGYNRNSAASLEAGVKYLICGGLSSALLLAGIVLLYGLGGNTVLNPLAGSQDMLRFDHLHDFVTAHHELPLVKTGVILVISGVAFKIGAFPFNLWIPDVYQGAPSPAAALLAIGSKAVGVLALIQLCAIQTSPFAGMAQNLKPLFISVAALTLLFGNIAALGQHNVKRLLGLSGISHAGFLIMGVLTMLVATDDATFLLARFAVLFYLFAYLLASTVTFGVVGIMAGEDDSSHSIQDYTNLHKRSSFLSLMLASGVGSLAGIPPSLGFIAKLLVVVAAFKAGLAPLAVLSLVCVAMGVYYYFGWIREAFSRSGEPTEETNPLPICIRTRIVLGAFAAVIVFGFFAQPLFSL